MTNPVELCSECPWPGKCQADEVCWLEVELNPDPEEPPDPEEDPDE